ncbi:ATPase family AAA domain-containing protein 2-like [Pistacia vera]|uniref:ATPase family AAA domain-containing protein 2-like n=1 Tax=Pistacia vera TaxID=55513 RepID=UPI001263736D|nr:ATPase family AAA domain-containing protein 2-like [Pistacia vera]
MVFQSKIREDPGRPGQGLILTGSGPDWDWSHLGLLKKPNPDEKPVFNPLLRSQVLGKVKDFLGMMSEANKRLQLDAKEKAQDYDIEVLTGNESEVIEMDLMLGVADLHTPETVMAAESAIAGNQPMIPFAASRSGTDSEGSSEDSGDDDDDKDEDDDHNDDDDEDDEYSDNDDKAVSRTFVILDKSYFKAFLII